MPMCVVKWCRSHSDLKKTEGVTFHVFPANEPRRKKWIAAVRLERGENDWTPTKRSIICSLHFEDENFYKSKKGNHMLKKTAIPICTMVFSKETSTSSRPVQESSPVTHEYVEPEAQKEKEISEFGNKSIFLDATQKQKESNCDYSVSGRGYKRKLTKCPSCNCEFDVDISDEEETVTKVIKMENFEVSKPSWSTPLNIPSSIDTPKTHLLKKKLKHKTCLAEKLLTKIRNIERRNKRLLIKNLSMKYVIAELKKKEYVDSNL